MTPEQHQHLLDNGLFGLQDIDEEHYAALLGLMFTHAIVKGRHSHPEGYDDRWCYHSPNEAAKALLEWRSRGFTGEPKGWHRHPISGRRRENGDPATEYINP